MFITLRGEFITIADTVPTRASSRRADFIPTLDGAPRLRKRSRPLALATLAVVGALLLSGCSGGRGSDSETTEAGLLALPGIAGSEVKLGESRSGLTVSRSAHVTITLKDGYVAGDADELVDWLFRTGWSVNDKTLNGGVLVSVRGADDTPVAWDYWPAALTQFGLPQSADGATERSNYEVTGIVGASTAELESLLGPWPGDIPEFTDDLIVKG